ncbi:hypothetical protein PO587_34765 [Streptomyces gilvifuscus]|uniref:Uncharacterized protein n=1 Tax=Streptomyces gilvifuscus TaxID=1550617 RepID=A0ABT5G407_9ACTN|nr:hypothetical protein [Streptomyces gilvifuscus]MDC2959601.1 hypothetical protein [Streptomyces gilvifuscus]
MGGLRLRSTPVGDVLLIHPKGRFDDRAAAFAGGLAEDPRRTLVVVDLPADVLAAQWQAVARLLSPARYGDLRLVFGRGSGDDIRTAARLIAGRLGREVLAPDGTIVPTAGGGLFVPGDEGAAWLRFRPDRDPEPESQRFPKPDWEFSVPTRTRPVGTDTVVRPVPAGVWLHHADRDPLAAHHRREVEAAFTDIHLLKVVLGSPGTPPLPLDDVAAYWQTVLPGARAAVRFVVYGTLDAPGDLAPGQALADALDHEVVLSVGLNRETGAATYLPAPGALRPSSAPPTQVPLDEATAPDVVSVTPAASEAASVAVPVSEQSGLGGASAAEPSRPHIRTESVVGVAAAEAGAQAHAVEGGPTLTQRALTPVVSSPAAGRHEDHAAGLPEARTAAATDVPSTATVEDGGNAADLVPQSAPVSTSAPVSADPAPEHTAARDLDPGPHHTAVPDLHPGPRQTPAPPSARPLVRAPAPRFRLESAAPGPGSVETVPAPDPGLSAAGPAVPAPDSADEPSASAAVQVQPIPKASACALPPERGIAQERDWVRRTFSEQFNAVAGSVSRVMSESPGLRGRSRAEAADALTELVAVRLYLSGDSRRADAAVRAATAGPHVPLARCVTAGLRRLPSYRGPALLRTRLTQAERSWYRPGRPVTEWAFCHARTALHPGPRGSDALDVLIWSMTARRTSSLDPAVPDRVLFLPGTVFTVLRADDSVVLLRELSPSEAGEQGRTDAQRAKLDEIAVKGLEKILDALERAGTDAAAESADPPGLIVTPRAVVTEGAKP